MRFEKDAVLAEDLENIGKDTNIPWEQLREKTVLITGATGLIGSVTARALVVASVKQGLNTRVLALVRNREKAEAVFGPYLPYGLEVITGDVTRPVSLEGPVAYLVHGASVTSSKDFVDRPVETIGTTLSGTEEMLKLARKKQAEGMVYLSSMEAYGVVDPEHFVVRETDYGYIDPLQVRSSYPEGKRMAEGLCAAYAHEYGVPVKIARLAQTFGAGVPASENRVFAQFAKSVLNGEDVVLHTDGKKAHCYCYTSDAVRGILTILLKGAAGEAYNVSNEKTFSTIREMAELVTKRYPEKGSGLVFDIPEDAGKYGYAPPSKMLINAEKLRRLGWKPEVPLEEMYDRLIDSMKEAWTR